MARELLRPEEATNWDDFLERIALERSAIRERRGWRPVGVLLSFVSMVAIGYAAGSNGQWWEWVVAVAPLCAVGWMTATSLRRADLDKERLRELDLLELGWKSHLEHVRH